MLDTCDAQAESVVDAAHPLCVAACEVVVDRDNVDSIFGDGIECNRRGCSQRLAFTGAHFGDLALVQHDAAHELNVEVPLTESASRCFTHVSEDLGKQVVEALTRLVP